MKASLSIIAHADLCGDLLPEGEDGEILEAGAGEAWAWLCSRATLAKSDEVLVELPPAALLKDWRSGAMDGRDEVERRFMEKWQPPQPIWLALEELVSAGVGQVLVYRDCD